MLKRVIVDVEFADPAKVARSLSRNDTFTVERDDADDPGKLARTIVNDLIECAVQGIMGDGLGKAKVTILDIHAE